MMTMDGQHLTTYLITMDLRCDLAHYAPLASAPGGSPVLGKHHNDWVLEKWRRLRPSMMGRSHWHPLTPDREALKYWFLIHQSLA
jgi:hypothetical protein